MSNKQENQRDSIDDRRVDKRGTIIGSETRDKIKNIREAKESNEKLEQVIVVTCGPPHSGKSVFLAVLKKYLPREETSLFRAAPDGEGTWSQLSDSDVAQNIRQKGEFTKEVVDYYQKSIENIQSKRVIVDVGGLRSEANEKIFDRATHFVVVCRSDKPEEKEEWEKFGKEHGLTLIASIDSVNPELKIEECSEEDDLGVIRGQVGGLDRDNKNIESTVISEIAAKLLDLTVEDKTQEIVSEVDGMNKVSLDELAKYLAIKSRGKTIISRRTGKERKIYLPIWHGEDVRKATDVIGNIDPDAPVWLDGGHPAFLYSAIVSEIDHKETWLTDFKVEGGKRKLPTLELGDKPNEILNWKIEERDEYTFVDISIPGGLFDMNNLEKIIPPVVNPDKGVVLSGKLPFLIFCSLTKAYKDKVAFVSIFTPQQKDDAGMKSPAMIISGEKIGKYIDASPIIKN